MVSKSKCLFLKVQNISFWPRISEIKYNEFPILAVFQSLVWRFTDGPPYPICLFYYIFLEISEIFSIQHVKPPKIKLLVYHGSAQWSNLCYQGFIMDLKLNNFNCLAFLYFFHYSREIDPNPFFLLFTNKKCNIFHSLSKLCKINPNFNLILSNEITIGANHK